MKPSRRNLLFILLLAFFLPISNVKSVSKVYPYVEIKITPKAVEVGEPLLVTVTGYDNYDVDMIALYYNRSWHTHICEGIQKECSYTWEIKHQVAGVYVYHAYAKDNVGNYPFALVSARAVVYDKNAEYFEAAIGKKKFIDINKNFEESGSYVYDLDIGEKVYSMTLNAKVRFRKETSYVRVVLKDENGIEYLLYELYPLISKANYVEIGGLCEETCVLDGILPKALKIELAFAEIEIKSIAYSNSPGLISENTYNKVLARHRERLKYRQQVVKMETLKENVRAKGVNIITGLAQIALTPYQEKRKIFTGEVPVLHGAEYNIYGAYGLPEPKKVCECFDNSECPSGLSCDGCYCVRKEESPSETPKPVSECKRKTCADYLGMCGKLDDGCGGYIECRCGPNEDCSSTIGPGYCIPKKVTPSPGCGINCYSSTEECKFAFGEGTSRACDCKEAVTCSFDSQCNCYRFGSCVNSVCGSNCVKKTCADYPGKCGEFSDGCGGTILCECPTGQNCKNGLCEGSATTSPSPSPQPYKPDCICISDYQCHSLYTSDRFCCDGCKCYMCDKYVCQDSDNGLKPEVAGRVTKEGFVVYDECIDGDTVKEYYCGTDTVTGSSLILSKSVDCDQGKVCINGACLQGSSTPTPTCSDTDNGKDIFNRGTVTTSNQQFSDYCEPSGTLITEYYCQDNQVKHETISCPPGYSCLNGRCQQPTPTTSGCKDSDGKDIFTKGITEFNGNYFPDICTGTNSLIEHYCAENEPGCDSNGLRYFQQDCPTGYRCIDGACVKDSGQPTGCKDDDGRDYYRRGTTTDQTGTYIDKCSSDGTKLYEYYCVFDNATIEEVSAPGNYICKDGAFVEANPSSTCIDSDGKDIYTKGTVNENGRISTDECTCGGSRVKEMFCYKGMTASEEIYCPTGYTCIDGACVQGSSSPGCTDSDGGKNFSVRGLTVFGGTNYEDFCNGNVVTEYYCEGGKGYSTTYLCPNGCSNGACKSDSGGSGGSSGSTGGSSGGAQCTDSDGGMNYFVQGTLRYGNTTATDKCQSSNFLVEYFCDKDQPATSTVQCQYGCSNGACKTGSGSSGGGSGSTSSGSEAGTGTTAPQCTDSDGGLNYYTKGTAKAGSTTGTDYCTDANTLVEYGCSLDNQSVIFTLANCYNGCSNGACN
ncbi:MAG: hypothetical protein QXM75_03995 [Candidatus Diapherotrites archaeon]